MMLVLAFRAVCASDEVRMPFPGSLEIISMSAESRFRSNWWISMAVIRLWVRNEVLRDYGNRC